jgi:NHL repeat
MKSVAFVSAAQRAARATADGADLSGGWYPRTWLGAPAPGGLALPAARPTASWMYAPRGVYLGPGGGRDVLVIADTGNHRVMIWHEIPDRDEQPCDVVLGQPDAVSEGPAAGCGDTRTGLNLPTGVLVHDGRLVIADAWHHRVLVYNTLPEAPGAEPDLILGQANPGEVEPNRGGQCGTHTMYWPFGVAVAGGRFYVADTGNRRVLGWSGGLPDSAAAGPDLILGQPDPASREENRGGPPGPASFRWPHGLCGTGDRLFVADAGDHRVLGWTPHPDKDADADVVLGQPDFAAATEMPYVPQRAGVLRFPYAVDTDGTTLAVADTANNRILLWDQGLCGQGSQDQGPVTGRQPGASIVLGQQDFAANGENRWSGVTRDSLCWPYGLSLSGGLLAVADSGNNRVVIWSRA